MRITSELTDTAVLHEIGDRLERRRIDAGLTQAQLAEEAGISKRTVERIEAGHSTDFVMLLRVLRVLETPGGAGSVGTRSAAKPPFAAQGPRARPQAREAFAAADG